MRNREYYIIDCESIRTCGRVKLTDFELKLVSRIRAVEAVVVSVILFVAAVSVYVISESVSSAMEMESSHMLEVETLVAELDSMAMCHEEGFRIRGLHAAIYEAVTDDGCERATRESVWRFIQKCGAWYPDIIMAQAVQESGSGSSDVARRCNNLFGMKKPGVRSLRCDINRGNTSERYAEYGNWKMSVIDRIFWDMWMFRNTDGVPDRACYLGKIGTVYNTETSGYTEMINKISRKYRAICDVK